MHNGNSYDAIIIGGGPAGSTAAAGLALKGRRAVVLEKEKFPRYHIGESLLPYGYFTLERIGVLDRIKSSHFTRKYSGQSVGDCLIGNFLRDFQPLFEAVSKFAAVPGPLPHGAPLAAGDVLESCR